MGQTGEYTVKSTIPSLPWRRLVPLDRGSQKVNIFAPGLKLPYHLCDGYELQLKSIDKPGSNDTRFQFQHLEGRVSWISEFEASLD